MHNRVFRGSKLHLMRMGNIKCKNNADFFSLYLFTMGWFFTEVACLYACCCFLCSYYYNNKKRLKKCLMNSHENIISMLLNNFTPLWSWLRSKSYKHCSFNSRRRIVFDLRNSRVPSWYG